MKMISLRTARRLKVLIAAAPLFLTATAAPAGTITGTVQWVISRASDGLTYAMINGTASGQPACATKQYWIIMDENSEAGKKQYAMLLVAQASGQQITIGGHNTCARWPDGEDIDYVQIVTPP